VNPSKDKVNVRNGYADIHCEVKFRRKDNRTISAAAERLTVIGFHCIADEPFSPGEFLECEISIPQRMRSMSAGVPTLHCEVRVLSVEIKGLEPGFRIACQLVACRTELWHN
jgi:hypothetical protein